MRAVSSRNLTRQVFDLHHRCPAEQGAYSFISQEQIALLKEENTTLFVN